MSTTDTTPRGILSGPLLWSTVGTNALIFLGAFDALAVTTIMPTVARELDGAALFSAAFAATLAASVVGMVVGGGWVDRRGPTGPLVAAVGIFVVGLVVSATAVDMPLFVVGRFLQGLGNGAMIVAIYVIVARLYPVELRTRIFASFAAAWVIPGLVGPAVAGAVSDSIGWPWVFLGIGALVVVGTGAVVPALARLARTPPPEDTTQNEIVPTPNSRLVRNAILSVVVALAVMAVSVAAEFSIGIAWIVGAAGIVVVVVAVRPLLPARTLLAEPGIGSSILVRAAAAAAFFATEARLPYLLQERYGMPSWAAGLVLTVGAVAWAAASQVMGRLSGRLSEAWTIGAGGVMVASGIVVEMLTAFLHLHPVVAGVGWFVAAAGMGMLYPLVSTLVLGYSRTSEQGFNSSALSMMESVAGATGIAVAGLIFLSAGGVDGANSFALSFLFSAVVAALVVVLARRVVRKPAD
ncbi:MAG: MFS transporter [Williamsia herbipolensis]|nr:MFS transporter [Williamsia herbipolensis]